FGAAFAAGLRRRRVRVGDKWHLDEVALKIRGKRHWLWRAVDQHGVVPCPRGAGSAGCDARSPHSLRNCPRPASDRAPRPWIRQGCPRSDRSRRAISCTSAPAELLEPLVSADLADVQVVLTVDP